MPFGQICYYITATNESAAPTMCPLTALPVELHEYYSTTVISLSDLYDVELLNKPTVILATMDILPESALR